ncbi:MAG: hypothetical protein P4L86_12455, partial [Mycobacterium sp.]|nr:hypothetical protein [Mycobacterium sp.]
MLLLAALAVAPTPAPAQTAVSPSTSAAAPPSAPATDASRIVAVVYGDAITKADVDNRRRLFALSTGMSAAPDVLDRLTPQVTRQLIDERLR